MATWKVVYVPPILNAGMRGTAIIEADNRSMAMFTFQRQYEGQYHTIEKCEKIFD